MRTRSLFFMLLSIASAKAFSQVPATSVAPADSNMIKQYFFAGLREKMSENYVLARSSFEKIIGIDQKNDAAFFELANVSFRLNKLNEAEEYIKQAIQLRPQNKWYKQLLAEVYKRTNKLDELAVVFSELISIEPDNAAYYYDRANALFYAGKQEEAKSVYGEIEKKFGASDELSMARRRLLQKAEPADSDIVKLLEGNKADVKNYVYAAGLLLQKGNTAEAMNVLKKAQQIEPDNYELNLSLADVYRTQKNNEAAFGALKKAFDQAEMPLEEKIKIIASLFPALSQPLVAENVNELSKTLAERNPADARVLALYGDVLYQQNKLNDALVQYKQALKLNEQIYAVWEQVINVHTLLGHYTDAVGVADEALSLYPNQAGLYYYMAYALFKTGKQDAALSNLKNALSLDQENKGLIAQVYALQGDIYINQNNFALAKTAFENSIAAEPDNYLVINNYAYYLALKNDDLVKAEKLALIAVKGLPDNPSVADTYAFILFKQQKYTEAQTWIERALQNNTAKNGVYLERYGDILFLKGEKEKAIKQWIKAKEAGNGSEVLNKKINEKKYFK